jgi:hypothetical protein
MSSSNELDNPQTAAASRSRRTSSLDVGPPAHRRSTLDVESSPALRAVNFAEPVPRLTPSMTLASDILMPGTTLRSRRLTNDSDTLRPFDFARRPVSVSEMEFDDDEDDALSQRSRFTPLALTSDTSLSGLQPSYVKTPLRQYSYQTEHLVDHLVHLDQKFNAPEQAKALGKAFGDVFTDRLCLNEQKLLQHANRDDSAVHTQGNYEVYDIGKDGQILEPWRYLSDADDDSNLLSVTDAWTRMKVRLVVLHVRPDSR